MHGRPARETLARICRYDIGWKIASLYIDAGIGCAAFEAAAEPGGAQFISQERLQ